MIQDEKKLDSYSQGWIGVIPDHWRVKCVKHIARFTTGWTPPTGNAASYIGVNPWANIGDLGPKVITETANQISDEAVKSTGIKISPVGSLLFSFKLSVGQVSIAGQSMFTNEAIATFPPQDDFDTQWAYYAFPKFIPENAAINIYGAKLLNQQRINDALLPFPPKSEQIAIASYLDAETKRIDELIAEKLSLKVLLKEWRLSVIWNAVTKGVGNGKPITPSGVPWLGVVPKHWSIEKLKFFVTFAGGGTPSKSDDSYWSGSIPWVSPKDMKRPLIGQTEDYISEMGLANSPCSLIPPFSVLTVVRSGILQHSIPVALNTVPVTLNQDMKAMIPDDRVDSRYLVYQISGCQKELREAWVKQGATVESIEHQIMADSLMAVPPIEEQRQISNFLDVELGKIDHLVNHVNTEIDLLTEMRSATITDAVLGRIDVRKANTH